MINLAEIEQLIDKHGLMNVVDTIVQACYDKSEHIKASYQDNELAKVWEQAGASLVNPKTDVVFPS